MTKSSPTKAEARAALSWMAYTTLITTLVGSWAALSVANILLTVLSLSGLFPVLLAIAISLIFVFGLTRQVAKSWDVLQEYIRTSNPTGQEKSTDFGGEELSSNAM